MAGTVRAADGTPVPGATLRVIQTSTGKAWITWTDDNGTYEFPALPSGHYRAEVSQLGFAPANKEIDLVSAVKTPLDLKLDVGTLAAITAPPATENAAKPANSPPAPADESAKSAPPGTPPPSGAPPNNNINNKSNPSTAAANNGATTPASGSGNNGNGGQRGGRNGQGGGGRRAFQQVGLNGQNQNSLETTTEDQNTAVGGGQLGDAASADAVQMTGTVAMGLAPAGGPAQGGDEGPSTQGAFGNENSTIPGQTQGTTFGGPGGGGPGPGGGFGGGPPRGGRGGGAPRGRGPQGPQGVAALWGANRVMRQRINRVHYSFYDTYGNAALNARPYSLYQINPPKIAGWTETAGMNIGGPLKIPHIYDGTDKTFFYINFGGTWTRTPVDSFATVPTDAERAGDFSNVMLYNPATGQPFSGCPQSCSILPSTLTAQEKTAQTLLGYIPLPNITEGAVPGQSFNYHLQTNVPGLSNRLNANITHQISSKLSLQVNYNLTNATSHALNNFPGIESNTFTRGQSVMIGLTQNYTKTFVHTSQLYFSRSRALGLNEFSNEPPPGIGSQLGLMGISTAPEDYGLPSIGFTNFTGLSDPTFTLARSQTYRYVDSLKWIKSKHTITIGGEIRKMEINRDTDPAPNGQFSFTGQLTSFNTTNGSCDPTLLSIPCGNDFADFLLGDPANTKVQFGDTATYFRNWGFVGYATDDWHMFPKFTVTYGIRYEAFTPPTEINGHIANLEVNPDFTQVQCVTPVAVPPSCVAGSTPSLFHGHYNNWAPRLGIAWQPPGKLFSGQHQLTLRAGFSMFYVEAYLNTLAAEMANQPPFATANTLTPQTVPSGPLTFLTPLNQLLPGTATNTVAVNPNYQVPYAMVWNTGIEYTLTRSTFLELMYTGTRGVHLDELLGYSLATDTTTAKAAGFTYDTTGAFSNFNALQVRLQKRVTRGLGLTFRYTYSKSLDDASTIGGGAQTVIQNNADPAGDYGLSSFDMRHQILALGTYALPFGDRQRFATKGWRKDVFGAWRLNASTSWHTGSPYTVRVFSKNPNCQNVPGINSERADQTGNPALADPTAAEYFNTAVFAVPIASNGEAACFGDAPRNSVEGPGLFTINSGLTKTIQFGRDGLRRLDIVWNASNLTNHLNFAGLSTVLGSSTFGQVTGTAASRSMTFTTRFNF